MKIKNFQITIIELVSVIFITVGVVYIVLTVVNNPLYDMSEFVLEDLAQPMETKSQDNNWAIESNFSDWPTNDTNSSSEIVEETIPQDQISEEELEQFESLLSDLEGVDLLGEDAVAVDPLQAEREEAKKELNIEVREALADAKRFSPMVKDYQEQREAIASQRIPSQKIIEELEALEEEYEPYVSRLAEIYPLVTDTEVVELLGDWVKTEADVIFGALGW